MLSVTKSVLAVSAFVALTALSASAEDLTIVSTVTIGDHATTQTQYLAVDRSRVGTDESDSITEYATGRLIAINHKKKEYTETTIAEMAASVEKAAEQMQKMPAFLRKATGDVLGEITVRKGTTTRKIAGYDCTQYVMSMGEDIVFDLWVTSAIEQPLQVTDAMKAQYAAAGPAGRRMLAMYDEMKKIKGLPLATDVRMKFMGQKVATHVEATDVRRGPIPPGTFAIPTGYKKKDSPFKR